MKGIGDKERKKMVWKRVLIVEGAGIERRSQRKATGRKSRK